MPIINPTQLVDEFKKSGEFDRLRRELLAQFRNGDNFADFMDRVENVALQKLASDNKVKTLPETSMVKELMQDLNRYPIIERAVTDMQEGALSQPDFKARIRSQVTKILQEDRTGNQPTSSHSASASAQEEPSIDNSTTQNKGLSLDIPNSTAMNGIKEDKSKAKTEGTDGNESEDSAMLESPMSDVRPLSTD